MDIKREFESILYIDKLIDCKIEEKNELKRRLTDIKSPSFGDKVQGSKDPDKLTDTIGKIMELEKEITDYIDLLIDKKQFCFNLLKTLNNNLYSVVLHKLYFEGRTLKQCGVYCGKTARQIVNIRDKAFVQLAEMC